MAQMRMAQRTQMTQIGERDASMVGVYGTRC